jgi:hypothetical protein
MWVRSCTGSPSWISPSILKYERDLFAGRIRCPFKIARKLFSGDKTNEIIDSFMPIALTPTGKIKA